MNKLVTSIISVIIVLLILGATLGAFKGGFIRLNYPPRDKYPLQGLDISHHQKDIEWDKIDKNFTHFIFMKATEGGDHIDSRFKEYSAEAKKRNIPFGAYHYFTFCTSGEEQASNYIANVPNQIGMLPPAIDLEYGGNCLPANRYDDILKEVADFIRIVENHYHQKVIIYTTPQFYKDYLTNAFIDSPLWFRNIYKKPQLENNRKWTFWQYANRGRLDGFSTFVDFNVFHGNEQDFKNILKKE